MKCNVCGQEFGNGAYCQHCNTDRITALGSYSGGYTAPGNQGNKNLKESERSGIGNSGGNFIICYKCYNVIPVDSEYCPCCKTKLFETCPKCGHKYSSQYRICNKCGTEREAYIAEQKYLKKRKEEERLRKEKEKEKEKEKHLKLIIKIVVLGLLFGIYYALFKDWFGGNLIIRVPSALLFTIISWRAFENIDLN